jgi:hypothetical protein
MVSARCLVWNDFGNAKKRLVIHSGAPLGFEGLKAEVQRLPSRIRHRTNGLGDPDNAVNWRHDGVLGACPTPALVLSMMSTCAKQLYRRA